MARGACSVGRRNAAQQRGPHLCAPARPERDAQATRRGKAHGEITASCATSAVKEKPGPRRPAGQRDVAGGESREQSANLAHGTGIFRTPRRGATCGPHLCTPRDRNETHEQWQGAQRCAQQPTVRPRATGPKKTWGKAAGRAARRCPQKIGQHVCDVGTRRQHLWKPRHGRNSAGRIFARRKTGARRTSQGTRRANNAARNNAL